MITLDGIELPYDIEWIGRFNLNAVAQQTFRTLSGKFISVENLKVKGRKIALKGGDHHGWAKKTTVDALNAIASITNYQMLLEYEGQQLNVIFDHEAGAVQAETLHGIIDPGPDDLFILTVNLIEI